MIQISCLEFTSPIVAPYSWSSRKSESSGFVHSGRKGTALNIVGAAVRKMSTEFGSDPEPSSPSSARASGRRIMKSILRADIVQQLKQSGVKQVFDCGENTAADLEKFYSYRMEKGRTGRMLALLALKRR